MIRLFANANYDFIKWRRWAFSLTGAIMLVGLIFLVTRGVNYNYAVVLANRGQATYGRITLSVIHEDPITRSSIPYRSYRPDCAIWRLAKFKPDKTFRVSFRLPFKQHNDPKGSNLTVGLRADRRSCMGGLTKDVIFVKK